jgi:hypothetical protein
MVTIADTCLSISNSYWVEHRQRTDASSSYRTFYLELLSTLGIILPRYLEDKIHAGIYAA